jgi:hypothetical protein
VKRRAAGAKLEVMKTQTPSSCDTPNAFVAQHAAEVIGELHGFDRVRLQGTLPPLYAPDIMHTYLLREQVLYKDFATYTRGWTDRMRADLEAQALRRQRPVLYLRSNRESKEELARQIVAQEEMASGVICGFSVLENGRTWEATGNRQRRRLELHLREKRVLHFYVYLLHAVLGFMFVRFQLYFPFLVQMGINGREWLAQQMTRAGLGFRRERNTFSWLEDPAAAQLLMDQQLATDWPALCNGLVDELNPLAAQVRAPLGLQYYWTTPETEYATDVMFRQQSDLAQLYPSLVQHGIMSFGAEQVLRFLGRRTPAADEEIKSSRRRRVEGLCLKHRAGANSIKMYDKGSVLRVETTINQPKAFRVLRSPARQPDAPKKWRPLRRSTADLHRRAQISQAANQRYFTALSTVHDHTPLRDTLARWSRRVRWQGHAYRALNPLALPDARWLSTLNDARWTTAGLTNADLRSALYGPLRNVALERKRAGQTTRLIRLLRAHGILRKVPKAHRYHLTPQGRRALTAILAASQADTDQLTKLAA